MKYPLYEIALSLIEKVGSVTARQLISYAGSAEAVFQLSETKLLKIPNVGGFIAKAIFAQKTSAPIQAEKIIEQAQKSKVKILAYTSPDYPQRLKNIYDSPLILYAKGDAQFNSAKTVAIVGTREATEYGKTVTEEIIQDLKPHNTLIISGLAYGIDIIAHRASLKNQLPTVGVMASGLDIIYPATHQKTAQQMIEENGAIISENPFGTKPDAMRFPARNRIIAGMADAIIVVEAKIKGGALITAQLANDYNKDVFAVPGGIFTKTSEGCNQLIKAHQAHLFTGVKDLEYLLNWDTNGQTKSQQATLNFAEFELKESEKQILQLLQNAPKREMFLDEISFQTQTSVAQISAYLLNLELLGLVKAMPGKKFGISR